MSEVQPINPKPFLKSLINTFVDVRLKFNKTVYRGELVSTDNYFNIRLTNTEEFINGKSKGQIGDIFIRCNNVLWVSSSSIVVPAPADIQATSDKSVVEDIPMEPTQ